MASDSCARAGSRPAVMGSASGAAVLATVAYKNGLVSTGPTVGVVLQEAAPSLKGRLNAHEQRAWREQARGASVRVFMTPAPPRYRSET
jgi:hypothetical protein